MAIITEYLEKGDLREQLKKKKEIQSYFSPGEVGMIFIQIFLGIYHLHKNNIAHRDLKPANIFINNNDIVKIGDFGFAKRILDDKKFDDFLGTAYYIAPEIWKRESYDKSVDIFALGVIIYELLMLRRPFTGSTINHIQHATLSEKYPRLVINYKNKLKDQEYEIFVGLDLLIKSMIVSNPQERATVDEILEYDITKKLISCFIKGLNVGTKINNSEKTKILNDIKNLLPPHIYDDIINHKNIPLDTSKNNFTLQNLNLVCCNKIITDYFESAVLKKNTKHDKWNVRFIVLRKTLDHTIIKETNTFKTINPENLLILCILKEDIEKRRKTCYNRNKTFRRMHNFR
jgi:serine/threonine protein kinase